MTTNNTYAKPSRRQPFLIFVISCAALVASGYCIFSFNTHGFLLYLLVGAGFVALFAAFVSFLKTLFPSKSWEELLFNSW